MSEQTFVSILLGIGLGTVIVAYVIGAWTFITWAQRRVERWLRKRWNIPEGQVND